MSEAYGSILIKAPAEIINNFAADDESVSWETMSKLFACAGIESLRESHELLSYASEDEGFYHEGVEIKNGFIEIEIFGDSWMHAMQPLVAKGKNIEVYGSIDHEHGVKEFYALNPSGKSYFEVIDFEGGHNEDRQDEITAEWLKAIPDDVKNTFPDVFTEDDEDE